MQVGVGVVLRPFEPLDAAAVVTLFRNTVHLVNSRDYTVEQINAWAPPPESEAGVQQAERLAASLLRNFSLVAVDGERIVGFGDVSHQGYLDHLYVHHAMQGLGIGAALLTELESAARRDDIAVISTDASITAKPFFASQGYEVVSEQTVRRFGTGLVNYRMQKRICG